MVTKDAIGVTVDTPVSWQWEDSGECYEGALNQAILVAALYGRNHGWGICDVAHEIDRENARVVITFPDGRQLFVWPRARRHHQA